MSEVTAVPLRPIAKGSLVKLWVGIAALVAVGVGAAYYGTHTQIVMAQPPAEFLADNANHGGVITTPSGLQYKVLEAGQGPAPVRGDVAKINYEGKFLNDKIFDSSARHGGPVPMQIGGNVPGFDEALQLMPKGAKFRIWLPPALGYGEQGTQGGEIPPHTILVFDVTMIDFASIPMGMGGHGGM